MTASRNTTPRLASEVEAHRQALLAFIETAERLPAESWNAQSPGDKWSPAQVSEHLRLTYATVCAELAGQGGVRLRTKWWQRVVIRLVYLPRILRGRFPKGVPAIREIRPASRPYDRQQLLSSLRDEGERFLHAVTSEATPRNTMVTHPFLGRLGLIDGVRFTAQHIRHHHAQILPAAGR